MHAHKQINNNNVDWYLLMYTYKKVVVFVLLDEGLNTVYCKLFEVEKFHGWTRYFKFAGKLLQFVHPAGQKCAHVHTRFHLSNKSA